MRIKNKINFGIVLGSTICLIFYILGINQYFWLDGDNVTYTLLGESILKLNYKMEHLVTNPPHLGAYWPGFPALLAVVQFIFGKNIKILKLISVASVLITLVYFYYFIKEKWREKYPFIFMFLIGLNPVIFTFAHTILTQAPFLMCITIGTYYVDKVIRKNLGYTSKEFIIAIFFIIFSKYIRAEGDFFFIIVVLSLAVNKKWKHILVLSILFIILTGVWWLRDFLVYKNACDLHKKYFLNFYIDRYGNVLKKNPYDKNLTLLGIDEFVKRGITSWKIYFQNIIPLEIFNMGFLSGNILKGMLIFITIIVGFFYTINFKFNSFKNAISSLRTIFNPFHLYFIFGLSLALLATHQTTKYIYPIVPSIIYFFIKGIEFLCRLFKIKIIYYLILGLTFLFFFQRTLTLIEIEHQKPYYDPFFEHYIEVAKWCGKNLPKNSRIITRKPEYFYWYSNLKGSGLLINRSPEENLKFIYDLKFDYLTITYTGFDWNTNPTLFNLLKKYPDIVEVIKVFPLEFSGKNFPYALCKIKLDRVEEYILHLR